MPPKTPNITFFPQFYQQVTVFRASRAFTWPYTWPAAILRLISLYHKHLSTKELAECFQVAGLFTKGIRVTAPVRILSYAIGGSLFSWEWLPNSTTFHCSFLLLESSAPDNIGAQAKNGHYYIARLGSLGVAKPRQVPNWSPSEPTRNMQVIPLKPTGKETLCL